MDKDNRLKPYIPREGIVVMVRRISLGEVVDIPGIGGHLGRACQSMVVTEWGNFVFGDEVIDKIFQPLED